MAFANRYPNDCGGMNRSSFIERGGAWIPPTIAPRRLSLRSSFCPSRVPVSSTRQARVTVCTISESDDSATADAYKQFSDMLDLTTPVPSPRAPERQSKGQERAPQDDNASEAEAYADFSEMLGLENIRAPAAGKTRAITKGTPKKVEIDPEDYALFDEMLERTGGTGKKPMKGSKPYVRQPISTRGNKPTDVSASVGRSTKDVAKIDDTLREPQESDSHISFLSEEEKAEAYAVMMEEFGPGDHHNVEVWLPDTDVTEVEQEPNVLLKPPPRRGKASDTQEEVGEVTKTISDVTDSYEPESVQSQSLKPKPIFPTQPDTTLGGTPDQRDSLPVRQPAGETDLARGTSAGTKRTERLEDETKLVERTASEKRKDHPSGEEQRTRELTSQILRPPAPPAAPLAPALDSATSHLYDARHVTSTQGSTIAVSPTLQPQPFRGPGVAREASNDIGLEEILNGSTDVLSKVSGKPLVSKEAPDLTKPPPRNVEPSSRTSRGAGAEYEGAQPSHRGQNRKVWEKASLLRLSDPKLVYIVE